MTQEQKTLAELKKLHKELREKSMGGDLQATIKIISVDDCIKVLQAGKSGKKLIVKL